MKLKIYPEVCCDMCGETVHNHIDCPICGEEYAATDIYHDLSWFRDDKEEDRVMICECRAAFKATKMEGWIDDWEWELVGQEKG